MHTPTEPEDSMSRQHVKPHSKTHAKKREILERALACFSEHGVTGTTIEMLRDATGASVGSLYHHFGNKEAIASAVFIEGMNDFGALAMKYLSELMENPLPAKDMAERAIKVMVYANVDWITRNPDWARFVFQNRRIVSASDDDDVLRKGTASFYGKLIEFKAPLVAAGYLKDLPIELYGAFISGPVHDYARHYLAGRHDIPLSEYREILAEGAWHALKGYGAH
jgi:AcrR family transcriptional regulator